MANAPDNLQNEIMSEDSTIRDRTHSLQKATHAILGGELDIAKNLDIAQATANKTIKRLQKQGFIKKDPYRSIFLTNQGKSLANFCKSRHEIVYNFLIAIGVKKDIAKIDAEGLEHHVSAETLEVFEKFTKKL